MVVVDVVEVMDGEGEGGGRDVIVLLLRVLITRDWASEICLNKKNSLFF